MSRKLDSMNTAKFCATKKDNHVALAEHRSKIICIRANDAGVHAEIAVLKSNAMKQYKNKNVSLYVKRISAYGHSMSRPCKTCSTYIKKAWPRVKVFYTDESGVWKKDENLDTSHVSMGERGQT